MHHWDTDGICSAAIIGRMLNTQGIQWRNYTPPIGEFCIDDLILSAISDCDRVFIVDLNIAIPDFEKTTLFIDHHIQNPIQYDCVQHINPVINGESRTDFPSATWVVSTHYSLWDHLSALGALGDVGKKLLGTPLADKVNQLLASAQLSVTDALSLVALIDSSYIVMNRDSVQNAVQKVMKPPTDLLNDSQWQKNLRNIKMEIDNALNLAQVQNNYVKIDFTSGYNIISKVARQAVWVQGHPAALVINRQLTPKSAQIYFRISSEATEKFDIPQIIDQLKDAGFNAGGKREVLGVVCPPQNLDNALGIIHAGL